MNESNNPQSNPPSETNALPLKSSAVQPWHLVLVLVLGIVLGCFLPRIGTVPVPTTPPAASNPPTPPTPPRPPSEPLVEPTPVTPPSTAKENRVDARALSLEVNWQPRTTVSLETLYNSLGIKDTDEDAAYFKTRISQEEIERGDVVDFDPKTQLWKLGIVRGSEYDGATIYLLRTTDTGMGYYANYEHLLVDERRHQGLLLGKESYEASSQSHLLAAPNIRLNVSRPLPTRVTLENGKQLVLNGETNFAYDLGECTNEGCPGQQKFSGSKEGINVFAGPAKQFFASNQVSVTCLKAFQEDGRVGIYTSIIPSNTASSRVSDTSSAVKSPYLIWKTEFANNNTFLPYTLGGCGFHECTDIMTADQIGPMSGLVEAGKTIEGDPIYFPKDPKNHGEVRKAYESWMDYDQNGEKPSFNAFMQQQKVPIFFWKDAFGRWIRYSNDKTLPLAECGKPVIYLYPERTMGINVKLPSFVQVTVSEPTYPRTGWNVTAEPNGSLTMSDGSKVGSLFWEGLGVSYQMPNEGFIVKDGEVDSFLKKTLAKYGLNETESREFRDFWAPKMIGAAYYRVAFLTDAWDKAAPLNVTPRPKTSIRLFMDWRKLAEPISIPEPKIITPTRDGFTLVEWGGTLYK